VRVPVSNYYAITCNLVYPACPHTATRHENKQVDENAYNTNDHQDPAHRVDVKAVTIADINRECHDRANGDEDQTHSNTHLVLLT
jgi:hypothetical protein